MNLDWVTTIRQSLPRLGRLSAQMRPTFRGPTIASITPDFLAQYDVDGIVWDIDGTVMAYHEVGVDPTLSGHAAALFSQPGLRHAILSNCGEERFVTLSAMFPDIPILRAYQVGSDTIYRRRMGKVDTHTDDAIRDLLDRGGRAIRKPDARLLMFASATLDLPPDRLLMVGDQYLTDVATANLAGVRSFKVDTFRQDTFPLALRFSQALEAALYRVRHGSPEANR